MDCWIRKTLSKFFGKYGTIILLSGQVFTVQFLYYEISLGTLEPCDKNSFYEIN